MLAEVIWGNKRDKIEMRNTVRVTSKFCYIIHYIVNV